MSRPLIVGIGGTTRHNSSSELALRASLRAAEAEGAHAEIITGEDLVMPTYIPGVALNNATVARFIDLVRRCDGLIVSTPSYHGGISGLIKNALDYTEELRQDERPYLQDRAVGCIVCAGGWQGVGSTLASLRSIIHALRAWPTPMGAGINTVDARCEAGVDFTKNGGAGQLAMVGQQVARFALQAQFAMTHANEAVPV